MAEEILLDAGSGGRASQRLIREIFFDAFANETLLGADDAALLAPEPGRLAFSTDSYTVDPIFFAGGSIGSLAISGTVNDVAMLGAEPLWLSAGFIIEEGFPLADLRAVVADMAKICAEAGVAIVTGDTKVVPKGACDRLFINTAGIGRVITPNPPQGSRARPGDAILLSGSVGDHGLTIMASRNELSFLGGVKSDCAPLGDLVRNILACGDAHVLRDPTRGGLATTLNEIAEQSGACIEIDESSIPVHGEVADACAFLGLDPLYLANEGKCICILPEELADQALAAMQESPYGQEAAIIGRVTDRRPGSVILNTRMGGQRLLGMLEGAPLPRIC